MTEKSALGVRLSYVYLALPFAIFSLGWLRLYIGIPVFLLLGYGLWHAMRNAPVIWTPPKGKSTYIRLAAVVGLVILVSVFSGIGALTYQNSDHYWRNSILRALCQYRWPVYETNQAGETVSLVYYIGMWLPAALFGKLFGVNAAHIFMLVWVICGILLVFRLCLGLWQKFSLWPFLLFFLFGGLDFIWPLLSQHPELLWTFSHIEWASKLDPVSYGSPVFQYSSFVTQLYWVFNQALPAWLATVLVLLQKNNKNVIFIFSLLLINAPFPFIGLIPLAAVLIFTRRYEKATDRRSWWKCWFSDTFTMCNVLCGGVIGVLTTLYITANQAVNSRAAGTDNVTHFVWKDFSDFHWFLLSYVIFVALEVLIYLIPLYKYCKKLPLYWAAAATLMIVPLFSIGGGHDFCMRASIPALFMLFLLVVDTLRRSAAARDYITCIALSVILFLGIRASFNEFCRAVQETFHGNTYAGQFELMKSETDPNFVARISHSFFYRFIARK